MVAYSFQKQFAEPILAETKGGTIRAGRKRHARPGEELQLYTGMRTKYCRLIARRTCLGVQPITLMLQLGQVWIDDRLVALGGVLLDTFAIFDGFGDWAALREFWRETHGSLKRFDGCHIRWLEWPAALPLAT